MQLFSFRSYISPTHWFTLDFPIYEIFWQLRVWTLWWCSTSGCNLTVSHPSCHFNTNTIVIDILEQYKNQAQVSNKRNSNLTIFELQVILMYAKKTYSFVSTLCSLLCPNYASGDMAIIVNNAVPHLYL